MTAIEPESMATPTDELEALLDQLAIGELDPAGWRRVAELIRGDRDAARRYATTVQFCEALRDETGGPLREPLAFPPADPTKLADTDTSGTASSQANDRRPPASGVFWMAPWALAVSVAFACGWLGSLMLANSGKSLLANQAADLVEVEGSRPLVEDAAEPLMRLTGLTPLASSDGLPRSLAIGAELRRGEVVQLGSGAARFGLGVGEVLVQGPAEFSAIDRRTVFVRSGRVTVASAESIAIHTPVADVRSQGGKVAISTDGEAEAYVSSLSGAAVVSRAPRRNVDAERLGVIGGGDTLRVTLDRRRRAQVATLRIPPEGLLANWEATTKQLHAYERLVLSERPLAYWPLSRVRRHRAVLDLTQNGYDGHAIGNWPTELSDADATQVRGAYFDGESYVESDRKPPVDLRTGFTIESWARVTGGPEYQSVFASRWVLESNTKSEQCFGFTLYAGENDKWQFWTGSGAYGVNWDQLHAGSELQRNRWTHVVASFEPDAGAEGASGSVDGVVRIYIDGDAVAEARHTMSLVDFEWPARIGAAEFVPKSLTSWLFQGELRDVAVYDHVLDESRVAEHHQQGRSAT